jgi:hypothetical protein
MADKTQDKSKGGRPSTFTQELADVICSELAMGYSLRTVCKPDTMPAVATIFNWFRTHPEFLEQYTRAKEESADAMADDILDIADDGTNDWTTRTDKQGNEFEVVNNDVIQRSRLRVETRKWLMAKMKPKRYGDKLDVESGGKPITFIVNRGGDEQQDSND